MGLKKRLTYHALMYVVCEHMRIGVTQLQRNKWARQPINKMCTRARQPMDNSHSQ